MTAHLQLEMLAQFHTDLRRLESQFTSGDDHHGLDLLLVGIDLLDDRNAVRSSLSSSVLSTSENILSRHGDSDRSFLDGRWLFPALLEDAHEKITSETEVFEVDSLRLSDILEKQTRLNVIGDQNRGGKTGES